MRWINRLVAHTVVVHTTTQSSLRGIISGIYKDSIVLKHAEFLSGDTTTTIDGEVIIPRERVAWIQTLTDRPQEF